VSAWFGASGALTAAIVGVVISIILSLGKMLAHEILGDLVELSRVISLNTVRRVARRRKQRRMVAIVDHRGRTLVKVALPDRD
jgi:hypothetical protein